MSQKISVTVRAVPYQYAVGEKYKVKFGHPDTYQCTYLFHCLRLSKVIDDTTWEYEGVGEFDDNQIRSIVKNAEKES